ncbi:MAG TPA: cytochrome c [Pyrinomonadaceae bacterium]|jgi:mono/diheme cytochrome c family protein|nr:cytochrome c [Pyrinomonadaceae bacterium]
MLFLKCVAVAAAFSLLLIACVADQNVSNTAVDKIKGASTATPAEKTPEPMVENTLEAGKTLYANNCAKCHKEDGTGGKVEIDGKTLKADDLTKDKRVKMPDEKMLQIISDGIEDEGMPAMKDKLSQNEMKWIVRYVRTEIQKIELKPVGRSGE